VELFPEHAEKIQTALDRLVVAQVVVGGVAAVEEGADHVEGGKGQLGVLRNGFADGLAGHRAASAAGVGVAVFRRGGTEAILPCSGRISLAAQEACAVGPGLGGEGRGRERRLEGVLCGAVFDLSVIERVMVALQRE